MFARIVLALVAFCVAGVAQAADLTFMVKDSSGKPVPDAVIIADAPDRAAPAGQFAIDQKNMLFMPHVLVIPVGSTIEFRNLDPFRHHVYSFSPALKFELKLFGKGQTRPVRFDTPGLVSIGCNIHDSMQAFVQVVSTPFAGKTDRSGRVVLRGVPSNLTRVRIWHPRLRAPAGQVTLGVDASKSASIPVSVKLRPPAPAHQHY